MSHDCKGYVLAVIACLGLMHGTHHQVWAQVTDDSAVPDQEAGVPYLRPPAVCPADVETLTQGLLRDLPGYANRVAHRSLGLNQDLAGFGTVLLAGRAEFQPLDITPLTFRNGGGVDPEPIHQVFFTTLERHYTGLEAVRLEQYHWVFLTEADDGWRLALMFSRLAAGDSSQRPPTPPQESSDGIVGQAVRLWLRDCRAGAIYPVEAVEETTTER